MNILYTLVIGMAGMAGSPSTDHPPVAHLSYDTCQLLAQETRNNPNEGLLTWCIPDDKADTFIAYQLKVSHAAIDKVFTDLAKIGTPSPAPNP